MERRGDRINPVLIDPALDNRLITGDITYDYVAGLANADAGSMIENVSTQMLLLQSNEHLLPITIDNGAIGGSYVCRPHSAYALYAREELDLVDLGIARLPAIAVTRVFDGILRAANINRVVHLDNWMLSTNLHGDWHGEELASIRRLLLDRNPHHMLAIRSLDDWSSPRLLQATRDDGWTLIPSRQVWVVDDLKRDWHPRNAYGNDKRALRRSGLSVEDVGDLSMSDAQRIADLYRQLYVGRYSALNPIFTPAYIQHTHRIGMIQYRIARDAEGTILAVAGMLERAGVMTPPVVGYDLTRPRSEALYRIACYLFMERACERGLRLHGSAGAAGFKRLRGAHGVIEYSAFYLNHLSTARRLVMKTLAEGIERFLIPVMKARGL